MLRRIALLGAAIACAAATASAQELVFAGIPWRAPADSVAARLQALGYASRAVASSGDPVLVHADGSLVRVMLQGGRVVGFYTLDPAKGEAAEQRYRALADSLAAAFGTPLDRRPESQRWERGLTSAAVRIVSDRQTGERRVSTDWTGPGWYDEMMRRSPAPNATPLPAGFTTVSLLDDVGVSVDTATLAARAGQPLRARFRVDHGQPQVDGAERYDAIEYRMDFDCAAGRTRMVSRTTYLAGTRRRSDAQEGLPWQPARPGTDASRGLDAVCRVAGRGAELAAQRPGFAAPAAGWVLASERGGMRWLVDSASVRLKSAGIHSAVLRAESGVAQSTPQGGRMDAVRMQVDADCAGTRWRITAMTALFQGRDLGPIPVPAQQAAWMPGDANPVVETVCRLASGRP